MIQVARPTRREMEDAYARLAGESVRRQVLRSVGWGVTVATLVAAALTLGYCLSSM